MENPDKETGATSHIRLSELRSFTTYSAGRGDMTAKSFVQRFESEATMVAQLLRILPFVLKGLNLTATNLKTMKGFAVISQILPLKYYLGLPVKD